MTGFRRWADLTSPELAGIAEHDPVAVWPLGAIEQHGPHLPLSTDVDIVEGLLAAALDMMPDEASSVLVLPTLAPAASLEHTAYAGTLSVAAETLIASLQSIGDSIARAGVRRLVLLNGHGGNRAAIEIAALKLRAAHRMLAVKLDYARIEPPPGAIADEERAHGVHGGALETALMRHLVPAKVREDRVADARPLGVKRAQARQRVAPSGEAGFAWMAQDLHPSGIAGSACAGDAYLGALLCRHYAVRIGDVLREAATFDFADLGA